MSYRITEITVENFKLFSDKQKITFEPKALTLLDGPNGFGKTSVFDAIEILINGNRLREEVLDTSANIRNKPLPFAHDIRKPVIITGILEKDGDKNDDSKLHIKREFPDPSNDGRSNAIKDSSRFYLKSSGEYKETPENEVHDKLGLVGEGKNFNMLYYVQQEESTSFLKKKETHRINELNILFNMESENKKLSQITKVKRNINSTLSTIVSEIEDMEARLSSITEGDSGLNNDEVKYTRIFENNDCEWDKESFSPNHDTYKSSLKEIKSVKEFVNNLSFFMLEKKNQEIKTLIQDNYSLGYLLISESLISQAEDTVEKYRLQKMYENCLRKIQQKNIAEFLQISNSIPFDSLSFEIRHMEDLYAQMEATKSRLNKNQNAITELAALRLGFWDKMEANKNILPFINTAACPMCGYDYKTMQSLIDKIDNLTKIWDEAKNFVSNELMEQIKKMEGMTQEITDYLQKRIGDAKFNDQIISFLEKRDSIKEGVNRWKKFLKKEDIIYTDLVVDVSTSTFTFENYKEELIRRINEKIIDTPESIKERFTEFQGIYQRFFATNCENIPTNMSQRLDEKQKYISSIYYSSLQKDRIKLNFLKEKQKKIDIILDNIEGIEKIYKQGMKEYAKNLIEKTQIPFFIFSGKLLQNFPGGMGLFIDLDESGSYMKILTNPRDTNIDCLSRLSTGQLAGVVISLVLAMNQTFSEGKFKTLLIDDPVQSMDEINTHAFIDILRNEFSNYQVIISTHEEEVSRLFRYKYKLSGINANPIDVRAHFHPKNAELS